MSNTIKEIFVDNKKILPYVFYPDHADGRSLVHLINLCLGKNDIVGAETGVNKAFTTCYLLQECPNIKTMYCIDAYEPYKDYIKEFFDGQPSMIVDYKEIEFTKQTAHHNVKFSGNSNRVVFLEKKSDNALDDIGDESLDFIFLDSFLTPDQIVNDLTKWYPKVKKGGLFAGHDWDSDVIRLAVKDFRSDNSIDQLMSCTDRTWAWFK